MTKREAVQGYVEAILIHIDSEEERFYSFKHAYGVAQCASLLAVKRGSDSEIAYVCGLLHDIYSFKTGYTVFHSINGAEMIRVAFKNELKDVFTEEEQVIIKSAVFHHSDKEHVHDEYDEVLKDADLLQHWLTDEEKEECICKRLLKVQEELGLPISELPVDNITAEERVSKSKGFKHWQMADIAEEMAGKKIEGIKSESAYREIIRYFPEPTAFDELKNGWCAAFVYHCAVLAGLRLPIRQEPLYITRFAGVRAWYEWGEKEGFCFREEKELKPERGDIVIYDNIIPEENKPSLTPWHDHIGIVLWADEDSLLVAEGNVDNKNVSGIVKRSKFKNIGCYLRIPEEYRYNGWKYDYKTGAVRQQEL